MKHFLLMLLATASAAPPGATLLDQRQDGKLNVHAKLENFLVVVATSKSNDFGSLGNLALQTLLEARRNVPSEPEKEDEYKLEESSPSEEGKEPYSVEILRIRKEQSDPISAENFPEKHSKPVLISENAPPDSSFLRSISKSEPKTPREDLKIMTLGKVEDLESKILPDLSLKLEKVEKEKVKDPEEQARSKEELKLIGDAIENCGPGRFRNSLGICELDETVDK